MWLQVKRVATATGTVLRFLVDFCPILELKERAWSEMEPHIPQHFKCFHLWDKTRDGIYETKI